MEKASLIRHQMGIGGLQRNASGRIGNCSRLARLKIESKKRTKGKPNISNSTSKSLKGFSRASAPKIEQGPRMAVVEPDAAQKSSGQHMESGALHPAPAAIEQSNFNVMDAVVKVFCVHTQPNYSLPWQRKRQFSSTSSGFMVAGGNGQRWLLTNAHSVEYHSQVKVKRRGDDVKFIAKVLAVGEECDIALLTVEDEGFWEGSEPLALGDLPALQDSVYVVGYEIALLMMKIFSSIPALRNGMLRRSLW